MNKELLKLLKIVLFILFIFIIYSKADFNYLLNILKNIEMYKLTIRIMLKLVGIYFGCNVLFYSIVLIGHRLNFKYLLETYFLSYYFNNFGLGSIGGDAYKWLRINKKLNSKIATTFSLLNEKIIGLTVLFSYVIISLFLFNISIYNIQLYFFVIPLSFLFILFFGFFGTQLIKLSYLNRFKIVTKINKIDFITKRSNFKYILIGIFFSSIYYLFTIYAFYFITRLIIPDFPILISFHIIPLVVLINTIPISFQGLGIREVSISYLFVFYGYSFEQGVIAGILLFIINLVLSFLSSLYYLKTVLTKS